MKTSKEKMIAGEIYQAMGRELFDERQYAKEQLHIFNNLEPSKVKGRNQIIKKLFGKTTNLFFIEPPFRCDYGYNIFLGDNFYANFNLTILDCAPVTIGANVMIGPNVSIFTAGHPVHPEPRVAGWEFAKPVTIEDNVWIGGHTVINPGVTIGKNTVIGSGSIVTKDIPENVIAVGNPCRVIRSITDSDKHYYYKNEKFPNLEDEQEI
ncbi:sugar O-acetyltransferase [Sphingobacterium deserti]|uniref:Acetyltransferase n=1 Tax=Sphingobacterium deserti TaxID=1229276 RepID=A0A0B8SZU2_9SPHI|nr:sugar O-acetyltransferase [Sphingobacterium deserti]KGE13191.1 galactoside-O-acetyltransferase [Sphingobacterium deserti]